MDLPNNPKPVRNKAFYWDWVVFLVEDELFKVPRHHFANSPVFKTVFTLPPGDQEAEGCSDEHPFQLRGINKVDFEGFLKVMYKKKATQGDWTSALRLSTMWEFSDMRHRAIEALSKIDIGAVNKIILAQEFNVSEWLLAGYISLAKQEEPISLEDARKLGWETTVRIFRVRETYLPFSCLNCGYKVRYCRGCGDTEEYSRMQHDFTDAIQAEFGIP